MVESNNYQAILPLKNVIIFSTGKVELQFDKENVGDIITTSVKTETLTVNGISNF